jgi:LysM repeat protein/uncharacterized protein YkwD
MPWKKFLSGALLLSLLSGFLLQGTKAQTARYPARRPLPQSVSAFDLILAMNTLRVSYGLQALIEDPIVNAVAQNTAEIMAASSMSWHIGDVSGRIQAAGYGGGAQVWATENFAVSVGGWGIDQIMLAWSDADHMRPATNPAYCHVGAGVATANGRTYYVLQAAYTSANSCGAYAPPSDGGGSGDPGSSSGVSPAGQLIFPVKIATPDRERNIYHVVEFGQSFWSIAVAYKITIQDLEYWNNLSRESSLQVGQRLFIPSKSTLGYATPTPVGLVLPSTPEADGKIIHSVEAYHTLSTISEAYEVPLDNILALNGIQIDLPLQIGQRLLISTGSLTPGPGLNPQIPLAQLTPDIDGNYYHTIASGETLSGIADIYDVPLDSLMLWNGLNADSIIRPGEKLLLEVTPPTPVPTATLNSTATEAATPQPPAATQTPVETPAAPISANPDSEDTGPADGGQPWLVGVGLGALGLILIFGMVVRKRL